MRVPLNVGVLAPTSSSRLLTHALTAWALTAVLLLVLVAAIEGLWASVLYALGAAALSGLVAAHYARHRPDAADPLVTAFWFTGVAAALDLIAGALLEGRLALFDPTVGLGIPLMLIFGSTGLAGELVSRSPVRARRSHRQSQPLAVDPRRPRGR